MSRRILSPFSPHPSPILVAVLCVINKANKQETNTKQSANIKGETTTNKWAEFSLSKQKKIDNAQDWQEQQKTQQQRQQQLAGRKTKTKQQAAAAKESL